MVIYIHNKHIQLLERALYGSLAVIETAQEHEAVAAALAVIEREKCAAPYRLWLRDEKARTAPASESGAL